MTGLVELNIETMITAAIVRSSLDLAAKGRLLDVVDQLELFLLRYPQNALLKGILIHYLQSVLSNPTYTLNPSQRSSFHSRCNQLAADPARRAMQHPGRTDEATALNGHNQTFVSGQDMIPIQLSSANDTDSPAPSQQRRSSMATFPHRSAIAAALPLAVITGALLVLAYQWSGIGSMFASQDPTPNESAPAYMASTRPPQVAPSDAPIRKVKVIDQPSSLPNPQEPANLNPSPMESPAHLPSPKPKDEVASAASLRSAGNLALLHGKSVAVPGTIVAMRDMPPCSGQLGWPTPHTQTPTMYHDPIGLNLNMTTLGLPSDEVTHGAIINMREPVPCFIQLPPIEKPQVEEGFTFTFVAPR